MAHVIGDGCVGCGSCAPFCPKGAISQVDVLYVIDKDACVDCGACEKVCPAQTIAKVEEQTRQ